MGGHHGGTLDEQLVITDNNISKRCRGKLQWEMGEEVK